mgnify:FL=1
MPGRSTVEGTPAREDYTGHELDTQTQLHYAGARYYMAALGRWTTSDPILQEKGPKKLLEEDVRLLGSTPYNYTFNNPTNLTDPTGKCPCDIIADIGFIAYDLYDIGKSLWNGEGVSATQLGTLGMDGLGLIVPFATGLGAAYKASSKADDAGRIVGNIADAIADYRGKLSSAADNIQSDKVGHILKGSSGSNHRWGDIMENVSSDRVQGVIKEVAQGGKIIPENGGKFGSVVKKVKGKWVEVRFGQTPKGKMVINDAWVANPKRAKKIDNLVNQ